MSRRLGLIQSRGIGDIIIALPIAKYYHDRGVDVYWPIDEKFLPSFKDAVDYVTFIPFNFKPDLDGFLQKPMAMLKAVPCERIVTLYSYLSGTLVSNKAFYGSLKFDEYKYAIAGVPFSEKWNLSIKRDSKREEALFKTVVCKDDYVVVHKHGSNFHKDIVVSQRFKGMQVVEIDEKTPNIFDWLLVLEHARCLILLDSCFANLVDQLGLPNEKIYIFRSEIRFTPVLRGNWQYYGEVSSVSTLLP